MLTGLHPPELRTETVEEILGPVRMPVPHLVETEPALTPAAARAVGVSLVSHHEKSMTNPYGTTYDVKVNISKRQLPHSSRGGCGMARREDKHTKDMKRVLLYKYENPSAGLEQISVDTSLSYHQVKHCIDDLRRDELLLDDCRVDFPFLGYGYRYRIDIFVAPEKLHDGHGGLPEDKDRVVNTQKGLARYILNDLPRRREFHGKVLVEDVRIMLGHPADLSATVRVKDVDAMMEFVTDGLRMCRAVSQTTSCIEAWSCRHGDFSPKQAPKQVLEDVSSAGSD